MESVAMWIGYAVMAGALLGAAFIALALLEERLARRLFKRSKFDGKGGLVEPKFDS